MAQWHRSRSPVGAAEFGINAPGSPRRFRLQRSNCRCLLAEKCSPRPAAVQRWNRATPDISRHRRRQQHQPSMPPGWRRVRRSRNSLEQASGRPVRFGSSRKIAGLPKYVIVARVQPPRFSGGRRGPARLNMSMARRGVKKSASFVDAVQKVMPRHWWSRCADRASRIHDEVADGRRLHFITNASRPPTREWCSG